MMRCREVHESEGLLGTGNYVYKCDYMLLHVPVWLALLVPAEKVVLHALAPRYSRLFMGLLDNDEMQFLETEGSMWDLTNIFH